jgi:hypothetical protein
VDTAVAEDGAGTRRSRDIGARIAASRRISVIAKMFIGLPLAATSVYSFERRRDRSPTVA